MNITGPGLDGVNVVEAKSFDFDDVDEIDVPTPEQIRLVQDELRRRLQPRPMFCWWRGQDRVIPLGSNQ